MSTALRESGMEADLIRIDPARNTYRFYRLARLPDYEERGGALVPILVLAHEHDPDPEMRPYTEPVGADRREQLIVGVAAGVPAIYRYFEPHRRQAAHSAKQAATYRRTTAKLGRNDPCSCGSGKKYKQCCGKVTMH